MANGDWKLEELEDKARRSLELSIDLLNISKADNDDALIRFYSNRVNKLTKILGGIK